MEEVQQQERLAQYVLQDQVVMEDQHKLRALLEDLLLLELVLVAYVLLEAIAQKGPVLQAPALLVRFPMLVQVFAPLMEALVLTDRL